MQAGFACADITPAVGMERPGGLCKLFHERLEAPLYATACVLAEGETRLALVGVDALSLRRSTVREVRGRLAERLGLAPECVLFAASHTHAGGPVMGAQPGDFAGAFDPEFCERLAQEDNSAPDPAYLELLAGALFTAVQKADARREEALLAVGRGSAPGVAFNRRFRMRDGRTMTHPGKGNPDILEPAGPTDAEVGVLSAWQPEGGFLGCVVNFACHGTCGGSGISPDWIGWMRRTISAVHGGEVVFLNGACGDLTQVDNLCLRADEFGTKWARRVGETVGGEALKVLAQAEPAALLPLAARATTLRLRPREVSEERFQAALDYLRGDPPGGWEKWFARDVVLLHEQNRVEPEVEAEVQVLQVGPAAYVANPGELFCALGLEIKQGSAFPCTWVVELANGCVGYVPTPEAMGPTGGGYEPRLALSSKLRPEAGPEIVRASLELLGELRPGALPEALQVEAPQPPWEIGASAPETV